MAHLLEIVEGTTVELGPFTLRIDDAPLDLTSMTVALKLRPAGTQDWVDVLGDTRIASLQTTTGKGQVFYTPDADDFLAIRSPYLMRWVVTDVTGKVNPFPNTTACTIKVNPL